jgi:hypothetical protein
MHPHLLLALAEIFEGTAHEATTVDLFPTCLLSHKPGLRGSELMKVHVCSFQYFIFLFLFFLKLLKHGSWRTS